MHLPKIPKDYELDYMVFQLSEGDPIKAQAIWANCTYEECHAALTFKQYNAFCEEKVING